MTNERQPQYHEFLLKRNPNVYGCDPDEYLNVYRVALGELIEGKTRLTYPPVYGVPDNWNKSGSIGFMDVTVRDERVPKKYATPLPNFRFSSGHEDDYPWKETVETRALVIETIGIEPDYRRLGFAKLLKQRAEEIAWEWGLEVVVAYMIQNQIMRDLNRKLGYILYDNGVMAVKYL